MSDYRVELLTQVAETGSLAEAARRMGLSYRRAWGKIREIEANFGARLVESRIGGPEGGRSRLTPEGRRIVSCYRRFQRAIRSDVLRDFQKAFQA